jgi:hypothetical protein
VVSSSEYQAQLRHDDFPELTNTYLCRAVIEERSGMLDAAGWSALQAAWAADDQDAYQAAKASRGRAHELFIEARDRGTSFAVDAASESAVLADLLRRCERFEEAAAECRSGLEQSPEDTLEAVLRYQLELIAARDSQCHTIGEALAEEA